MESVFQDLKHALRGFVRRPVYRTIAVLIMALGPVLMGLVVGLIVALGLSKLVESLLFGVEPSDPAGLVGGSLVLLITAALANYLPARRAGRVDPVRALKSE